MLRVLCGAIIIGAFSFCLFGQNCVKAAREVKPELPETVRSEYISKLENARAESAAKPENADALIWVGRRIGYLGEYKDAIAVFSQGAEKFPSDARFLRHRGHRHISLRCFDEAIADLEKAAKLIKGKPDQIEPDGMPNAKNIPTSTLQSNIWYHLGLAYYLKGDFKKALAAYKECAKVSKNNDMRVATAYWQYMTLRRMGKPKEAARILEPFGGTVEIIENADYLKLIKLNRGEVKAEDLLSTIRGEADTLGSASLGYGIGNYFLYNGDKDKAVTIFKKIIEGNQWASFGFIAAEVELSRRNASVSLATPPAVSSGMDKVK